MKRATVIEADKPIPSQLRIVQFNDGSPYETLHALVSKAITPYFKSYVKESGRADRYSYIFLLTIIFVYFFYKTNRSKITTVFIKIINYKLKGW